MDVLMDGQWMIDRWSVDDGQSVWCERRKRTEIRNKFSPIESKQNKTFKKI